MSDLSGKYANTLDEKGRLNLPSRLRAALETNELVVKEGEDRCLWLYSPEKWRILSDAIVSSTNPLLPEDRLIRRRFLGSAQNIDIDKAGRIALSQGLREYAGLTHECVILGQTDYIEIWDAEVYRNYMEASEGDYRSALEKLGNTMKKTGEEA
jgi:MraZ protein